MSTKSFHNKAKLDHHGRIISLILALAILSGFGYTFWQTQKLGPGLSGTDNVASTRTSPATAPEVTPPPVNNCGGNSLDKLALVSISQRHMWACQAGATVYDSPVVTGMENLAADLTPVGTYHIYAKQTALHLRGHDSTGSWDDFVNYWLPFLDNQYGIYGFHDATWRATNDFGNISPYSTNASHGCVELPLAAGAWLFNWASVGTTVRIES